MNFKKKKLKTENESLITRIKKIWVSLIFQKKKRKKKARNKRTVKVYQKFEKELGKI